MSWRTCVLVLCAAACANCGEVRQDGGIEVVTISSPRTTAGGIAIVNLDGHIEELESFVASNPEASPQRIELVGLLLERAKARRTYRDLVRAEVHADAAVRSAPGSGHAVYARARVRGAVHAFDAAARDLDKAERLGVDSRYQRASLALAAYPTNSQLTRVADQFALDRSFQGRATAAAVEEARANWRAADRAWVEALDAYRGVSPMTVAWVHFHRGVMWSERANDPHLGERLYLEAVRVFPGYVPAQLHLAELEALRGDCTAAITRLMAINDHTDDTETPALLAHLLRDERPVIAQRMKQTAHARHERWSRRFPEALAHHPVDRVLMSRCASNENRTRAGSKLIGGAGAWHLGSTSASR